MNLLATLGKWNAAAALALAAAMSVPVPAQPSPPAPAASRIIDVKIIARKPEGGVRTVRVQRGEPIALHVRSDEALSVHVHGYDVHADVAAGGEASIAFVARWTGRFPVAAHLPAAGSGKRAPEPTLLYLEVLPE